MTESTVEPMNEELLSFMEELQILCDKYKMLLGGCGCCGSPWVQKEGDASIVLDDIQIRPNDPQNSYIRNK